MHFLFRKNPTIQKRLTFFRVVLGPRVGPVLVLGVGSLRTPFTPERAASPFLGYPWVNPKP